MENRKLLVTGATGFLGSHFLLWNHQLRKSEIFAVIRGVSELHLKNKLQKSLSVASNSYFPEMHSFNIAETVTCVKGNIEKPVLGLSDYEINELKVKGINEFWHFAASLNYEESKKDVIRSQNIEGIKHALSLTKKVKAEKFIYVSTAYTSGSKSGQIEEKLHPLEGPFSNYYEESKCSAEHIATSFCKENNIQLVILRPSIVIGPDQTKSTGGSTTGLYGFIDEIYNLKPTLDSTKQTVRLSGNTESRLNLIPVDKVMEEICSIIKDDFSNSEIVHLSSDISPTVGEIVSEICHQLSISNLKVVTDLKSPSPVEKLLRRRTDFYGSYLTKNKSFIKNRESLWNISKSDSDLFIQEGIRNLNTPRTESLFKQELVKSADGSWITIFKAGSIKNETIILSNAYGMPLEFMTPLAMHLSKNFYVVCWTQRGMGNTTNISNLSARTHANDVIQVLNHLNIERAHIAGWCNGVAVPLTLADIAPERVKKLVFLNGSFNQSHIEKTNFEANMRKVMPKCSESLKHASFFHSVFFMRPDSSESANDQAASAYQQSDTILSSTEPELVHLTSLPYQSNQSLHQYAKLVTSHWDEDFNSILETINNPTLVVTGDLDLSSAPEESIYVADKLIYGKLLKNVSWDHFALYRRGDLHEEIRLFLLEDIIKQVS